MNRILKKILFGFLFVFILLTITPVKADPEQNTNPNANTKIELADGSDYLKYGTGEYVLVNDEYEYKDTEFRAVWVTPKNGGISAFYNVNQYKNEILEILEVMEYYNMNVLIFHIRIDNDAFYESKYNDWSSYYSTNPSWEALPWIIEQCHMRGIEFHAWMNPYRVTSTTYLTVEQAASNFRASNPASNPDNLLKGTNSIILDPGIPEVQNFLINTCMEVVQNYDIDAIHFDDYFYDNGVDDSKTRAKYNTSNLSLANFRRKQVSDFIERLSNNIRLYNSTFNKNVQLGISPSGVWQSGDGEVTYDEYGNAYSNGSLTTTGYQHYGNYHYADTVEWINNEWIDYILPQTYWALEHYACPYADLMKWWNDIVKYKNVSLYSGVALYQIDTGTGSSWVSNEKEGYNEIMVCNTLENVSGVAIYDYSYLSKSIRDDRGFVGVKDIWNKPIILPEIKNAEKVVLPEVTNLTAQVNSAGNLLTWDDDENAKFYVIYRSEGEVTFDRSEVIDVIGHLSSDGKVTFTDLTAESGKNYNYGVRVQSNSNTLNSGISTQLNLEATPELAKIDSVNNFYVSDGVVPGANIVVSWESIQYPFGDAINYSLEYSFDGGEATTISDFNSNNYKQSCSIKIPENAEVLKIIIKAWNNVAMLEEEHLITISQGLGIINGFAYEGNLYTNQEINFSWQGLESEGNITYYLQSSTDLMKWTDVDLVVSCSTDKINLKVKLPEKDEKVNYRIYAISSDGKIGYSDVLSLNIKIHLGDINNLQLNGSPIPNIIFTQNKEQLVITFDAIESYYGVSYAIYYSDDYKNWDSITKYYKYIEVIKEEDSISITIPINESKFKFYFKIEAYNSKSDTVSDVYTVFVDIDDVFYTDVLEYHNEDMLSFVNKQGIYK